MRRLLTIALLVLAAGAMPARAGTETGCDPATMTGGTFAQCLTAADKKSAEELDAAMANAMASIATRSGVFEAQRPRWKHSLADSQEIWLRFRNGECQEVAPFEGQAAVTNALRNRMAAFEARLTCSVRMNRARAADLLARYPPPGGPPE
jgi:uncharacterized protein YecT (DUF1311 family)